MSRLKVIRLQKITQRFETICDIGKGSYGAVQKCLDTRTNEIVAIKKIFQQDRSNDCPQNTIREVSLLDEIEHDNVVELKLIVQCRDPEPALYLVFEYCEYDLYGLLYRKFLDPPRIKSLMKQLLRALHACSIRRIVHRDLKPANMFVTKRNVLKLGDFGLARKLSDCKRYSNQVITLWYRPPELFLRASSYGPEVDIWSAGCIFYEMATNEVLFRSPTNSDFFQLCEIYKYCNIPENYLSVLNEKEQLFLNSKERGERVDLKQHLENKIPEEFKEMVDLLLKMLAVNPAERITAEDALNHPFLRSIGEDLDPYNLPELECEEIHQLMVSEEKKREKEKLSHQQLRSTTAAPPSVPIS